MIRSFIKHSALSEFPQRPRLDSTETFPNTRYMPGSLRSRFLTACDLHAQRHSGGVLIYSLLWRCLPQDRWLGNTRETQQEMARLNTTRHAACSPFLLHGTAKTCMPCLTPWLSMKVPPALQKAVMQQGCCTGHQQKKLQLLASQQSCIHIVCCSCAQASSAKPRCLSAIFISRAAAIEEMLTAEAVVASREKQHGKQSWLMGTLI